MKAQNTSVRYVYVGTTKNLYQYLAVRNMMQLYLKNLTLLNQISVMINSFGFVIAVINS